MGQESLEGRWLGRELMGRGLLQLLRAFDLERRWEVPMVVRWGPTRLPFQGLPQESRPVLGFLWMHPRDKPHPQIFVPHPPPLSLR